MAKIIIKLENIPKIQIRRIMQNIIIWLKNADPEYKNKFHSLRYKQTFNNNIEIIKYSLSNIYQNKHIFVMDKIIYISR